jgi:hypothetical protein
MSDLENRTKKPGRQINKLVIVGFLVLVLLTLLGIVFIPWDVPVPKIQDLELAPVKLDPAENAFTYFMAADQLPVTLPVPADQRWIVLCKLSESIGHNNEQWDPKLADDMLVAHAAVFTELEKGLACRAYVPPEVLATGHWRRYEALNRLCMLIRLKSKQAQLDGDYSGALQAINQGLQVGRLVTTNARSSWEWLTGIACQSLMIKRLEELASDVNTPAAILVAVQQRLAQDDLQGLNDSLRTSLKGQFHKMEDLLNYAMVEENAFGPGTRSKWELRLARVPYAYKPNMTQCLIAEQCRYLIANADSPYIKINMNHPSSLRISVTTMGKVGIFIRPNFMGKSTVAVMTTYPEKLFSAKSAAASYISALRLKIALRLYEMKHGELPDTLNALVPEYLPEIPKDPYDDQPFRYSKTEKKIWAVGDDLTDNGGKMKEANAIMLWRGKGTDAVMQLGTREMKPHPPPIKEEPKP